MSTAAMVLGSGIDAGGIDWIEKDTYNQAAVVAFPIYDGHGNMVATAGRVGSGFQNADPRSYDAWGGVRGGNTTGDPKQRYCANLGHVQDDESELIYMRARYYEHWTGRFVSEDPSKVGTNWFRYANNDPVNTVDSNGRDPYHLMVELTKLFMEALTKPGGMLRVAEFSMKAFQAIMEWAMIESTIASEFMEAYRGYMAAASSLPAGPFQQAALEAADSALSQSIAHRGFALLDFAIGFSMTKVMVELLLLDNLEPIW